MGVPSLVVEIQSESSLGKDSVKKLDLYLSTGVSEYWIVNPFNREITVYKFENEDVADSRNFRDSENAASFLFEGLVIPVHSIFG
jgi:Uma2 family endonuclease